MRNTGSEHLPPRLAALVATLSEAEGPLAIARVRHALETAEIALADVAPYVRESAQTYTRARVFRSERFEVLVMTWRPGQISAPHDHSGSLCAMRVIAGAMTEAQWSLARDGLVDPEPAVAAAVGEIRVDVDGIHTLGNAPEAPESLVTLHVYAPPLPELRRYARRQAERLPAFTRARSDEAPCVAILGGGFSGTLTAAHLIRNATERRCPLHVVLIDRQAAFGEGPAYRTVDPRHLLNVPAAKMSAWPDRPEDFVRWAQARSPEVLGGDYLPRKSYGEYLRTTLFGCAREAGPGITIETRQDRVRGLHAGPHRAWQVENERSACVDADAAVLAIGLTPPADPLGARFTGSRVRFVPDPWASLTLSAIGPDEPVLLLGSGLTAIDVLLTLTREPRRAPVVAVSRRGLLPEAHLPGGVAPAELTHWAAGQLSAPGGPTTRGLLRAFRREIERALERGDDWRSVVDGLRGHTASLWGALSHSEAARFLRHARVYWEVRRHRMAPVIAAAVEESRQSGLFRVVAGRIESARGDGEGVTVTVRRRSDGQSETIRSAWVVNCTGPADLRAGLVPPIDALLEAGHVETDPLALGVRTGPRGEAISKNGARSDLFVLGTLCKPRLWETTAVPDLRSQAATTARALIELLA